MADEIRKVPDEVKEDIENAQEGAVTDEDVEAVAGGEPPWSRRLPIIKTADDRPNR